ncbi:MAG: endonuclease/exonuclease/phosphatase family protein [Verrucomicrobiota bacterium]
MNLKVATYNILDGGSGREESLSRVLDQIGADVFLLQEIYDPGWLETYAQRKGLDFFFAKSNTKRNTGILSRFEIEKACSFRPFPPILKSAVMAKVKLGDKTTCNFIGVHLVPYPNLISETWRTWEIKTVLRRVMKLNEKKWILAGDFNAIAPNDRVFHRPSSLWRRALGNLQASHRSRSTIRNVLEFGFVDCFRTHSTADGFTFPSEGPERRLDYLFVSPALVKGLRSCLVFGESIDARRASDHLPVVAEFELAPS